MFGTENRFSTTYNPQRNVQVEQFIRTIVGQLRVYVEDHQDMWDELVSICTLACNSRPQHSTGVAPLEFTSPDRLQTHSLEAMVANPYQEVAVGSGKASARAIRECLRERLRKLVVKVRKALNVAQSRYKASAPDMPLNPIGSRTAGPTPAAGSSNDPHSRVSILMPRISTCRESSSSICNAGVSSHLTS